MKFLEQLDKMLQVVTGASNIFYLGYLLIILLEKIFLIPHSEVLERGNDALQILHVFKTCFALQNQGETRF